MKYRVIRPFSGPGGRPYARGEELDLPFLRGRQLTEQRYVEAVPEAPAPPVSARQRKEAKSA